MLADYYQGFLIKKTPLASLILFASAMILFTLLLCNNLISGSEFIALYISSGLFALGLFGFRRLRELDIKNLRIVLSEIKEVQQDIYAKEEDLRSITLRLAEILAFSAAFQGRYGSEESIKLKKTWHITKAEGLLQELDIPSERRNKVLEILNDFSEFDNLDDTDQKNQKHEKILRKIKEDIEEEKTNQSRISA